MATTTMTIEELFAETQLHKAIRVSVHKMISAAELLYNVPPSFRDDMLQMRELGERYMLKSRDSEVRISDTTKKKIDWLYHLFKMECGTSDLPPAPYWE